MKLDLYYPLIAFIKAIYKKESVKIEYDEGEKFQIDDDEFGILVDGILEGNKGIYFSNSFIGNLPFANLYDTTFTVRKRSTVLVVNSKNFIPELIRGPFYFMLYVNFLNRLGILNNFIPLDRKRIIGVVGSRNKIKDVFSSVKASKKNMLLVWQSNVKLKEISNPLEKVKDSDIGVSVLDGEYIYDKSI